MKPANGLSNIPNSIQQLKDMKEKRELDLMDKMLNRALHKGNIMYQKKQPQKTENASNKKSKKKEKEEQINKQPNYMNSTMSQQEFKTEEEYKM